MPSDDSALQAARHHFAGALQLALTVDEVSQAFLTTVGDVLPTRTSGIYRLVGRSGEVLHVRSDAPTNFLLEYEDYGRDDDPVLQFVLRHRRPIDSRRAARKDVWENSGACSALGGAGLSHSLQAPLVASGRVIGTINFARSKEMPEFSDTDLSSAQLISELLAMAIERARRFEDTGNRTTVMERALNQVPQALIVTDLNARVLFRNRSACDAELVDGHHPSPPPNRNSVEASLVEAIAQFGTNGKRVHIRSFKDSSSQKHRIVKTYRLRDAQGAAVTLVFDRADQSADQKLPAWDALSRREQQIAQLVSEGLTTKQIAERAFISENTAKQHLKQVFAKTDVRSRAELVRRMWNASEGTGTPH